MLVNLSRPRGKSDPESLNLEYEDVVYEIGIPGLFSKKIHMKHKRSASFGSSPANYPSIEEVINPTPEVRRKMDQRLNRGRFLKL